MRASSKNDLGLPRPDAVPHVVEDVDERMYVFGAEASAEIAGRGGIGNAFGVQGVEINFVVATQFQVL